MTDPIPINLSAIEARAAQREAKEIAVLQEDSQSRFVEEVERGFNPAAAEREQSRFNRFRSLDLRRKPVEKGERQLTEVAKKTEEDLAQSYHRRNPELPPDRLRELRDGLNQALSAEEVLEQVYDTFLDPTLADEALEYLEKETTGPLQESVRSARGLLNQEKGVQIRAGRNVDAAAKMFHKKGVGESPTELRELYRNIIGTPRDHNTLFSELQAKYSFNELKLVIAFLLKGLAFDLKSKGPSIQSAELARLMTEMRNLQSVLWVYLFFKSRMKLIKYLYKQQGLDFSDTLTFEKMAKSFVQLVEERYPSLLKLLKQSEQLGLMDETEKIIVLSQYRDAIRQLSPRLYKSLRHRQDLLLVILETLDELESDEEEE